MKSWAPILGAAAALCIMATPALAHRGAPGPIAGAGLPFVIAAGAMAYRAVRRRRAAETRQAEAQQDKA